MPIRMPRRAGMLLKTGQTTQYSSEADDGSYEKGIAKAYTVLSTGAQSGTSNIDLLHLTATDISFTAATKTIAQVAAGLAMFKTGETIVITGSVSNNGTYTIATGGVAGEIVTTEALVGEAAGASVSIAKREAHSNNCVLDQNTGLLWSRYVSAVMGTAGTGTMPWTGQLYDIFQYAAAANVASLGGYTDWRVANKSELYSIEDSEAATGVPDSTAFPSWPAASIYSATSVPAGTTLAFAVGFAGDIGAQATKTTDIYRVALVRGGV